MQIASLSLIESVTVLMNKAKLLTANITPKLVWSFFNGEPGVALFY